MYKKICSILSVLSVLICIAVTDECFAGIEDDLEQAKQLIDDGFYDYAESIYINVVAASADANSSLLAQEKLVCMYIDISEASKVQAAYQELITKYSGNSYLPKAVDHVADAYRMSQNYTMAIQLYRYIINTWPEAEHVPQSQRGIIRSYVKLGDTVAVEAEIQKLLTDFDEHPGLAEAVVEVSDDFYKSRDYQRARQLAQHVVSTWHENSIESQGKVILCDISLGDEESAQASLNKLLTIFSEDKQLSEIINLIGDTYSHRGDYEKAKQLYQYVLNNLPESEGALLAKAGIFKADIAAGKDISASGAIDALGTDFETNSNLPGVLFEIAEKYRRSGSFNNAKQLYQDIADTWPESGIVMQSRARIALSNILLGNDANAISAIEALITDYKDNPAFPAVLYRLAEDTFYGKKYLSAIQIFNRFSVEFPQDLYNSEVPYVLAACYKRLNDYPKAIEYYMYALNTYPDRQQSTRIPYTLGTMYREMGQYEESAYWFNRQGQLYSEPSLAKQAKFSEGVVYLTGMADYAKAAKVFADYCLLYPDCERVPLALYQQAVCYKEMGSLTQAISILQQTVNAYPNSKYIEGISRKLTDLQEGL